MIFDPEKHKSTPVQCPTQTLSLNLPGEFIHLPYRSNLVFEYGLKALDQDPPTIILIATGSPITSYSLSVGVDLGAESLLENFSRLTSYEKKDIQRIFVVGEQDSIRQAVKGFREQDIDPNDVYTFELQRFPKGYTHEWYFCGAKQMMEIPGFHR